MSQKKAAMVKVFIAFLTRTFNFFCNYQYKTCPFGLFLLFSTVCVRIPYTDIKPKIFKPLSDPSKQTDSDMGGMYLHFALQLFSFLTQSVCMSKRLGIPLSLYSLHTSLLPHRSESLKSMRIGQHFLNILYYCRQTPYRNQRIELELFNNGQKKHQIQIPIFCIDPYSKNFYLKMFQFLGL